MFENSFPPSARPILRISSEGFLRSGRTKSRFAEHGSSRDFAPSGRGALRSAKQCSACSFCRALPHCPRFGRKEQKATDLSGPGLFFDANPQRFLRKFLSLFRSKYVRIRMI
ncbi:hypothetical protein CLOSTASPAR_00701 [[Clostridium] asparagiforme DSM 15981]|uniref:Uncharacterized protein n=1 Tax=[Clostridium] asparagiforme DSM 15981 TaxID=518636 RepID=C0CUK9_9FIRM|nr:hypothetical protein CLOSTASPAR_00701 [[Clostridium] asparagiforme DSM 15981]